MFLKELNLRFFRNYDNLKITLSPNINIICGENAQGKTNLLESIYILSLTKSHRENNDYNIIKYNEKASKIKGIYITNKITTNFEIVIDDKKQFKINQTEIKKVQDYLTNSFNVILFTPQNLDLIQGGPVNRRNYLNIELSQISNNYLKILMDYNKILKVRNDYLKKMSKNKNVDNNFFEIITNHLIEKGYLICKMRDKFIKNINENCEKIFFEISKKKGFKINYITNFKFNEDNYKELIQHDFKKNINKEIKIGMTLYGPHRDDFLFLLDNLDLKKFGSQGQQRVAILSIKLAEIDIFKKYQQKLPILLLDDVFSELDNKKKKNIFKLLKNNIQVVITATELKNINLSKNENVKIFKIKDGKIINLKEVDKNGK